jgi:hypothetical protein
MLERLSADSAYAHRASGLRGSILRLMDRRDIDSVRKLDDLIRQGFDILEKAAGELRGLEDIRAQLQAMRKTGKP